MLNVFVLCTGRCGSKTFAKTCSHIRNFTSSHESRCSFVGKNRLDYPGDHIEIDNRLSWLLGRMDQVYGKQAMYVHLTRNPSDVASSFMRRWDRGIIHAYHNAIVPKSKVSRERYCRDYIETVNANIRSFLRDKPRQIAIEIEDPIGPFERMWELIDADGNIEEAIKELQRRHN